MRSSGRNFCVISICLIFAVSFASGSDDTEESHPAAPRVNCTLSKDEIICDGSTGGHEVGCEGHEYLLKDERVGKLRFWFYLVAVFILMVFAGIASGLTLGLMALDSNQVALLARTATGVQKRQAEKILPIVKKHHLLLVTLLLCNSICMEALPVLLERLLSPVAAIVVSVTALLFFGEIIPQSICTRYGIAIGAFFAPLVRLLMLIFFVIAWPVAKLLDFILGENHGTYYRRAQIQEMVNLHTTLGGEYNITQDESNLVKGAFEMSLKDVGTCMTSIDKVFMLDYEGVLDEDTRRRILEAGHSRIPVYLKKKDQIIGMILTKKVIAFAHRSDNVPIASLELRQMPVIPEDKKCYDVLKMFKTGKSHMALVIDKNDHSTLRGIVTMEDVLEIILGEVHDETDVSVGRTKSRAEILAEELSDHLSPLRRESPKEPLMRESPKEPPRRESPKEPPRRESPKDPFV